MLVLGRPRGCPATMLPSSPPAMDPRTTNTGGSGDRDGWGAPGEGLSELCGFESQMSIELQCHHGKPKVWKQWVDTQGLSTPSQLSVGVGNNQLLGPM